MSGINGLRPHSITLDEINDLVARLPPPAEVITEIFTTPSILERMRTEIPSAMNVPGFFGIPIILDDTVEPGEVRFRYADGHEESIHL